MQVLSSLTSLDLSGSGANDMTLSLLGAHSCSGLRSLVLSGSADISDDGLEHLSACTQLTKLVGGVGAIRLCSSGGAVAWDVQMC